MSIITIEDIQRLRKITGAGVLNCKNALNKAEGDYNKAIEIIRKKGHSVLINRGNCEISEGYVSAAVTEDFAAIIAIKCETDFTARGKGFIYMVEKFLSKILDNQPKTRENLKNLLIDGRKVQELLNDMMGMTGEKIELESYEYIRALSVISYVHTGNKLATIVGFNQINVDNQLAKDIAMQVAAMNPISIDKDSVPVEIIRLERKIAREKAIEQGKFYTVLDKIEEGALNKYFKENTLMEQTFIKNSKFIIRNLLNNYDDALRVTEFRRINLNRD